MGVVGVLEGRRGAVGLAILAGVLLAFRLNEPGWFDNEGRFAEGAREMVLRGDYVTPYVNFFPLLTKPPLTQWLSAVVFRVAGPSEWARLVAIAAAMITLVVTCRLGARLYGEQVGLVAGALLGTTAGFVLEARTLRPDCLVVAAVASAIFCWHVAETGLPARRTRWLAAMYAIVGVGTLAKGIVPVTLAGVPIAFMSLRAHGLAAMRRLRVGMGLAIFVAVVLPWHVAASLANPGFAWDYVVNQHILFLLNKKEPRDSEGDALWFYLAAFLGRSSPWVLFLPFTMQEAIRGRTGRAAGGIDGTQLLWLWVMATVGLFALVPSRLEHYSLPALPAVALLAARAWDLGREHGFARLGRLYLTTIGLALLAGGAFGYRYGEQMVAEQVYWLSQSAGLMALVVPSAIVACLAGALILAAVWRRSASGIVMALVVGIVPFLAILVRALIAAEALFSWRPVARALERVPSETELVFEAPVEYQIIGALNFYTRRRITMLEPPGGYAPPAYLKGRTADMFITRDDLEQRWRSGRPVVLVSDPQTRRDSADGVAPTPYFVLDRFGDRWVLTNFPQAAAH